MTQLEVRQLAQQILAERMPPSEILDRAADVMEARGKCNGAFEDARGRVCSLGAIRLAEGLQPGDGWTRPSKTFAFLCRELTRFVPRQHPATFTPIVDWSDSHTEAEVIAGLRAVAATLRAAEQTQAVEPAEVSA